MAIWTSVSLEDANNANRIDAEYFDPRDLKLIEAISNGNGRVLGGPDGVCTVLNGRTPSEYVTDGEQMVVRSGDLTSPFIYPSSAKSFLRTHKTKGLITLKTGDLLISSIGMGSIGKVSLVMEAKNMVTVSEVTILRDSTIAPEFLFCYLRSEAGQRQILREITGATGQQHLLKDKVSRIVVPQPTASLCTQLRRLLTTAWEEEKAAALHLPKTQELLAI